MGINWNEIKEMAAEFLSELIQIDTSNPTGNELLAVNWLAEKAQYFGLHYKIQLTSTNRANIIISNKPNINTAKKPIILLSHLDVVPAIEADWDVPPFSGKILNDELWGRGTIDTKQLTVTHLMLLILLKWNDITLERDVLMVATADEECGSTFGLLALLKEYEELFIDATVFNEGGGFPIHIGQNEYYLCEMGQKGIARVKITSSMTRNENPYLPNENSIRTMVKVINRLRKVNLNEPIPTATYTLLQTIGKDLNIEFDDKELNKFLEHIPLNLHKLVQSISQTTFSITKWKGGRKNTDLKGMSEIYIDSRPLPNMSEEQFFNILTELLKGLPVKYEIMEFSPGYETDLKIADLVLFEQEVQKQVKNARVVPFLSIGASDSRHLRGLNSQIYGYCPMLPDMSFDKVIKLVHGKNERIPLSSLLFGIQNMYGIVLEKGAKPCEPT
ncbi:M20/M25/M40 family metallo-hydrolase [Heyndrickxia sp. MSNUG]|uniref:M20/M25/M40 family metallo-hydrolase n=1 Tax=Heyndrickxia sp. MSNUG TaxID=3136677 RepID=UPI003C2D372E